MRLPRVYKWTDYDHETGQIFDIVMECKTSSMEISDGYATLTREFETTINGRRFFETKTEKRKHWAATMLTDFGLSEDDVEPTAGSSPAPSATRQGS